GGHHGDAREALARIDLGDGQALDVVAAPGKQADDARQHAGLVVHQHRDGALFDFLVFMVGHGFARGPSGPRFLVFWFRRKRAAVSREDYTSTMPSSEIGLPALSSGPSSIS